MVLEVPVLCSDLYSVLLIEGPSVLVERDILPTISGALAIGICMEGVSSKCVVSRVAIKFGSRVIVVFTYSVASSSIRSWVPLSGPGMGTTSPAGGFKNAARSASFISASWLRLPGKSFSQCASRAGLTRSVSSRSESSCATFPSDFPRILSSNCSSCPTVTLLAAIAGHAETAKSRTTAHFRIAQPPVFVGVQV